MSALVNHQSPPSPVAAAPSVAPAPAERSVETARRVAMLALLAGSLAIGFSPIFVRVSELPPVATAFWRVAIAMPALWAWLMIERGVSPAQAFNGGGGAGSGRGVLILSGLFFAGDLATWHWSLQHTSVANATLFANMAPLFVTAVSWLVFKERFSRAFLAGLAVSIIGVFTLMGGGGSGLGGDHLFGDVLGLITAMFYAGYFITVSRARRHHSTARIMTWSGGVTAAVLLALALVTGEPLLATTWTGWLVLAGLALISHAGGQSLIAYGLAYLPAAFSSLTVLSQPVVAAALAWWLLAEPLGPFDALGMALVLAGIAVARLARW